MTATDYTQFWQDDRLTTIIPSSLRYGAFPEGWDAVAFLKRTIAPLVNGPIVEIGAGYGRLSRAFPPERYLGLDVNPEAIERARASNPGYLFRTVRYVDDYQPADTYLAYTVLLHIPDEVIGDVFGRLCAAAPTVVVGEILGRHWRREGATPSFSRDRDEYEDLARASGFVLEEEIRRPYHYYPNAWLSLLTFRRKPAAPRQLSSFPADLADPYLQFSGLYEDGWTATDVQVTLTEPDGAPDLVVRGLLPQIGATAVSIEVTVFIDGTRAGSWNLEAGEFELRLPGRGQGQHDIQLRTSGAQQLPEPDERAVGVLLHLIGFASDADAG